ncbi:hypothetical protein NW768_004125 [Fusarium equiseti]|uniref:Protein kinase domain-containing protein n=1 Tax=Fusarium equiseti TaxID=61235 RepID=A0ABQ8RJJ0_FUSEQ|nr:hypothetical protein NW768_004125 [Fusarium equiseti]
MRHGPLRAHPNILDARGYGWNTPRGLIVPYILVDYAPLGTMREHISRVKPPLSQVEILVGDVASGLSILHSCGIVHGDIKLDNVLVFPSWDRPAKAIAKIADFGHAVILNEKSRGEGTPSVEYKGTSMYNAPEVHTQDEYPIDQQDLVKCDIWAFGLLIWEACLGGDEYLSYLTKNDLIVNGQDGINWEYLRKYAKAAVQGPSMGPAMFLRAALHMTLQDVVRNRALDARRIPLCTQWNSKCLSDLQTDMALHLESPTLTYEMFRLDSGREISWQHRQQVFQELVQTHSKRLVKDIGPVLWQIALCYHVGFGTAASKEEAFRYGQMAASEDHVIAKVFGFLLNPNIDSLEDVQEPYILQISRLLRSNSGLSETMPNLVSECFQGHYEAVRYMLSQGASVHSSTIDGCTLYHWLFLIHDKQIMHDLSQKLSSTPNPVNYPCTVPRHVHSQWPLQLSGSPLAVAISLNSLDTVQALLELGADPFIPVYDCTQFPDADPRSKWTAFHIAAKYHCNDILLHLMKHTSQEKQQCLTPLACALSFSSTLERLAMHRSRHRKQLSLTIATIQEIQTLDMVTDTGMTALMQAIDFQDVAVVSELLQANPLLAQLPFYQPADENTFNLPIHFAAQIASRTDAPETLLIIQLIINHDDFLGSQAPVPRDSMGRTPLHLAVTGSSNRVSDWILRRRKGLLYVEDSLGRVPLHYCASVANCELLLSQGATINHTDKNGMTALHLACYDGSTELVRCLLSGKPDLSLKNNQYGPPLHCGVLNGSVDTVVCLMEAGATVNGIDQNGNTATHVAARLGRHSILRILMQYGADAHVQNRNKRNAKMIAADTGDVGILRILQDGWETKANREILSIDIGEKDIYCLLQNLGSGGNQLPDFSWEPTVVTTNDRAPADIESTPDKTEETESGDEREMDLEQKQAYHILDAFCSRWLPSLDLHDSSIVRMKRLASLCSTRRLWQPIYAPRLVDFWARAVLVIIEIIQNRTSRALITALDQLADDEIMDQSIDYFGISGHEKAVFWIAIEFVARSIVTLKPHTVYPGRNAADFKDMIYGELRMDRGKPHDEGTLLNFFPELNLLEILIAEEESQCPTSSSVSFGLNRHDVRLRADIMRALPGYRKNLRRMALWERLTKEGKGEEPLTLPDSFVEKEELVAFHRLAIEQDSIQGDEEETAILRTITDDSGVTTRFIKEQTIREWLQEQDEVSLEQQHRSEPLPSKSEMLYLLMETDYLRIALAE